MFVSELEKLDYNFVPELIDMERRVEAWAREEGRDGWDILGYYLPKTKEIYLCEPNLMRTSEEIAEDLRIDRIEAYLVLRELVRLHEHIHALIHQKTGKTFPPEIDEPVTVFLTYQLINEVNFYNIFKKIDEKHPSHYKRWKEVEDTFIKILDNKCREGYTHYLLLAKYPLAIVEWFIRILKDFSGNSFNDLLKHTQDPLSVSALSKALLRAVLEGWEVGRY